MNFLFKKSNLKSNFQRDSEENAPDSDESSIVDEFSDLPKTENGKRLATAMNSGVVGLFRKHMRIGMDDNILSESDAIRGKLTRRLSRSGSFGVGINNRLSISSGPAAAPSTRLARSSTANSPSPRAATANPSSPSPRSGRSGRSSTTITKPRMSQRGATLNRSVSTAGLVHSSEQMKRPSIHGRKRSIGDMMSIKRTDSDTLVNTAGSMFGSSDNFQLFLDVKSVQMPENIENAELFFSVYSRQTKQCLTEEFCVLVREGKLDDLGDAAKCIFSNLNNQELAAQPVLVVRVVRIGPVVLKGKTSSQHNDIRVGYGCGFADLTPPLSFRKENKVYLPFQIAEDEKYNSVLAPLILSGTMKGEFIPNCRVTGGLKLFPGNYDSVISEHGSTFSLNHLPQLLPLRYPDVILPTDNRNDLYISIKRLENGSAKNMFVTVEILSDSGEAEVGGMQFAQGDVTSTYISPCLYKNNNPQWNEMFKITIPSSSFSRSHLLIQLFELSLKEKSKHKLVGFTFLPLTTGNGPVQEDKDHKLEVFSINTKTRPGDKPLYLFDTTTLGKKRKEIITVKTLLISTSLTQKDSLHDLLRWKDHFANIEDVLKSFTYTDTLELCKFLKEVMNCLFSILSHPRLKSKQSVQESVFDSLCHVIGLLLDDKIGRFKKFCDVLDLYITDMFNFDSIHDPLIAVLKKYIKNNQDSKSAKKIRTSMKSLEYLFKFIVASRLNYEKSNGESDRKKFKDNILNLFEELEAMMSLKSPEWVIGAQVLAVKNFCSVFSGLAAIFNLYELGKLGSDFLSSSKPTKKKNLALEQLSMIQGLLYGDLFVDDETRSLLYPVFLSRITAYMDQSHEEVFTRAISVLGEMINCIQEYTEDPSTVALPTITLLPAVVRGLGTATGSNRPELVIVIDAIIYLAKPDSLSEMLNDLLQARREEFLMDFFSVFIDLFKNSPFQLRWIMVWMMHCSVCIKFAKSALSVLQKFKHSPKVMLGFISFLSELSKVNLLQLEDKKSEAYVNLIRKTYGDLRLDSIKLIQMLWESLRKHQVPLIPKVTGPLLSMCGNLNPAVRKNACQLYASQFDRLSKEGKSLNPIITESINSLKRVVVHTSIPVLIQSICMKSSHLKKKNQNKEISKLMFYILGMGSITTDVLYEWDFSLYADSLLKHLNITKNMDLFTLYCTKICNQMSQWKKFAEAAGVLVLLAEKLDFGSESSLEPCNWLPNESEKKRKVRLYRKAIDYYNQDQMWERAIKIISKIKPYVQAIDAEELFTLEQTFVSNINSKDRFFPQMFRVQFYGANIPLIFKNVDIVCKGAPLERIATFIGTLQRRFPDAKFIQKSDPPTDEERKSPGMFIKVIGIDTSSTDEMNGIEKKIDLNVPKRVRQYLEVNDSNVFTFSKAYQIDPKKAKATGNEFAGLWATASFVITSEKFPSHCRLSNVTKVITREIPPLVNAATAIESKNSQISELITKIDEMEEKNISPLSMALNGVIDAAVNGGVKKYIEAFLTDEFMESHEDETDVIDGVARLKKALKEQLNVIDRGLIIHRENCPENLVPFQEKLDSQFQVLGALTLPVVRQGKKRGGSTRVPRL